uniref:ORF68 n=1 Tax=Pyropia endiviifolia TaxID=1699272 RepID=A0A1U6ZGJ4_9RHOD|nr:ORF68 [Pyropia endiviifolia]
MFIGQKVRVKYSKQKVANDIADKVGDLGIIRGIKFINSQCVTIIVEFDNHTRLWMFREELICLHE